MIKITEAEYKDAMQSKEAFEALFLRLSNSILEHALVMLPRVTAQLIKTSVSIQNMSEDFMSKNKEFKGNEAIVQKIVSKVEGENPGATYQDILDKAVPVIKDTLAKAGQMTLDFKKIVETK